MLTAHQFETNDSISGEPEPRWLQGQVLRLDCSSPDFSEAQKAPGILPENQREGEDHPVCQL